MNRRHHIRHLGVTTAVTGVTTAVMGVTTAMLSERDIDAVVAVLGFGDTCGDALVTPRRHRRSGIGKGKTQVGDTGDAFFKK